MHLHTTTYRIPALLAVAALLALAAPRSAAAQQATRSGAVAGRVQAADTGRPLPGVILRLRGTDLGALADSAGRFQITGVAPGSYRIVATYPGYRSAVGNVRVEAGTTSEVELALEARPLEMQGIQVSVLGPDLEPRSRMEEREVREANPHDSGELLRSVSGVDAVRRGPLGLDPVVRGLRETEVGTYMDGTRWFPAGPARMDSPLTHLDPSAIASIDVVKGPYALTWGAGNLAAVRVETRDLPPAGRDATHLRLETGYNTNVNGAETTGSVSGRSGTFAWSADGAWRQGDDYASGNGTQIPGFYRSWEGRGKVGVDVAPGSRLELSGGYQDQGPMDYPGRLLNAKLFHTVNGAGRWTVRHDAGTLRSLEALAYVNDIHHEMDNGGKPTAEPMPGRVPPFALDVGVKAHMNVWGGRLAADLAGPYGWGFRVGGDLYSAGRNALRTIRRADTGMLMFEDLMWPDAHITDGGLFGQASRQLSSRVHAAATVRLDLVRATADSVSDFFRDNVGTDLDHTEANVSAAGTLRVDATRNLGLSFGLGTAVRTADASERYSDRVPASKAQTSAEFVGNPSLAPERSVQGDVWLTYHPSGLRLEGNVFVRKMVDYITIEATDLPKRLPLSPDTVYRYVNGDAIFWGFEATGDVALGRALTLELGSSYLWGRDQTLHEPALGVPPLSGSVGLRWDDPRGRFFAESRVRGVTRQGRAAAKKGETPTDGYATVRLRGGVSLTRGVSLRLGVDNLTDTQYVNHLNAKNPFTGMPIPEPGRVVFGKITYAF
jgi:iron complex outermembrane receptor protein